MTIHEFADDLARALQVKPIPVAIATERDLEEKFVVPNARRVAKLHAGIRVYSHPWNSKRRCLPDCETAHRGGGRIQPGCPECWADSKAWASVAAFGTHHDFDVVAKDSMGRTLAVEIKLAKGRKGRMPSGEVQRFVGQCLLASAKHGSVVGVLARKGALNREWDKETEILERRSSQFGIQLVLRDIAKG